MVFCYFLDTDQTDESDAGSHSGPEMRRGQQPEKRRSTGAKKSGTGKQRPSDNSSKNTKM